MITLDLINFPINNHAVFKNEADFTSRFWRQISINWWFFHKISDFSLWFKPFDSVFSYKWLAWAIEFKFTRQASCVPFKMLSGSCPEKPWTQVKSLWDYQRNGWNSIVIVYSAKKHSYKVLNYNEISLSDKINF